MKYLKIAANMLPLNNESPTDPFGADQLADHIGGKIPGPKAEQPQPSEKAETKK